MPVYEYFCQDCKNKFELLRPFSRSNEGADCPRCRKKADRIISRCYSMTTGESGTPQQLGGSSSCSSCGSGNCGSCHN
jgi:putative FmdB family regulatory protein